jgi:hypothetical protein
MENNIVKIRPKFWGNGIWFAVFMLLTIVVLAIFMSGNLKIN